MSIINKTGGGISLGSTREKRNTAADKRQMDKWTKESFAVIEILIVVTFVCTQGSKLKITQLNVFCLLYIRINGGKKQKGFKSCFQNDCSSALEKTATRLLTSHIISLAY